MATIKYFIQFIVILFLFLLFRIIGIRLATKLSGKIFLIFGPIFRSKKIFNNNILKAYPNLDKEKKEKIYKNMWKNYGKILAEYIFIKDFRQSSKFSKKIIVENQNQLNEIKKNEEPVIFISGHFNNFELMAMHIEKSGIELAAVYRPLNNKFLNYIMEYIRKKYICKNQIKKGISGTKELLKKFKNGNSIALMIDQRVSEGISSNLFNERAFTTTIPAQFVKKFKAKIIPIYIERTKEDDFKLKIQQPLIFKDEESIETITLYLNNILEKMILQNPDQWIWTHNRWK